MRLHKENTMKKILLFLTLTLPLFAGQISQKQKENAFMNKYDRNGDNRISRQELPALIRSKFHSFDTDGNGYISRQELRNSAHKRKNSYRNNFNYYDKNRDGIISKHEMRGKERIRFNRLDRNRDRVLTRKEFYRKSFKQHKMNNSNRAFLRRSQKSFNHFDRNRNGLISKNEMSRKLKQNFYYYDKNHDGRLNLQEYRMLLSGKMPAKRYHKPGSFDYLDSNADGVLSKKELRGSINLQFYEFDLNGNNLISRQEFKTVKRQHRQNQQGNFFQDNVQHEENWHEQQGMQTQENQDDAFDYNKLDDTNSAYY